MQGSLFGEHTDETFDLSGATLRVIRSWLDYDTATLAFERIQKKADWQRPKIKMGGQWVNIPRIQSWYGDDAKVFTYSGSSFTAKPMFDELINIQGKLENDFAEKFNSVLVNCYRNASDSVGWHADDEPEFGINPVIASLSLGESRRFCLKPKPTEHYEAQLSGLEDTPQGKQKTLELLLNSGDLLLMSGTTQRHWLHCVPKESKACAPRINLTFRHVVT